MLKQKEYKQDKSYAIESLEILIINHNITKYEKVVMKLDHS